MSDTVRFIHEFQLGDAPPEVVRHARRFLLDLVGVAAAGSRLDASRILRSTALSLFGAGLNGSRFLFDGRAASPAGAALVNAGTIDSFDAHDGHPLTKGHAGCAALAGLLAFIDGVSSRSGAAALADLIVAYEIAIRAGMALHGTAADYHTSGAWAALGVAALGARSMRLGRQATREALGIAEYHGPRSQMMRCIDHPAMVKDGSAWGAMAGVTAAFMAREGFTGAPAITVEGEDVQECWRDLGARWRIAEQYMKPYPVCRWAQPAMEAVAQLRRDRDFQAEAIEAIAISTFAEAARLAARSPRSTDEAQYSLPYPVAALLVRGRLGAAELEEAALRDMSILSLAGRIELVEDRRWSALFPAERWAQARIVLKSGEILESAPAVARGSAENPLSDAEVSAKFHELMRSSGLGRRAGPIEEMVMSIEQARGMAPLLEELMRAPEAEEPMGRRGTPPDARADAVAAIPGRTYGKLGASHDPEF